ncbi:MAG TPA: ABC transporter permease [Corynebacterium glutamicum]|nr:ABC transporter permease [Corynebacterium glutamicum]
MIFGVELPSNTIGVLAVCVLGLCAFLALGCALSTLYPSTEAATGLGNIMMILLMLTSGAFTPTSVMPEGIQQVIQYSPVR